MCVSNQLFAVYFQLPKRAYVKKKRSHSPVDGTSSYSGGGDFGGYTYDPSSPSKSTDVINQYICNSSNAVMMCCVVGSVLTQT